MSPVWSIAGDHCVVHGSHRPTPIRTVKHHIHPQQYGGGNEASNLVLVCDTGHYNIHAVLEALLHERPLPKSSRSERNYALQGYLSIKGVQP